MREWTAERVAAEAGARLVRPPRTTPGASTPEGVSSGGISPEGVSSGGGTSGGAALPGPLRAVIDTRRLQPGDLFAGLRGENVDGGDFAAAALDAGAWGVLVGTDHTDVPGDGAVLVADDPLLALQRLARAWRRALGAQVIGVTGSTGKTSTKDLLAAILRPHRRTVASPENFNTEIGLPLAILDAPPGTEVLVLELAMRGAGQIAELTAIAEPDVGVIVNVGPVHLEILGTIEAVAATKAELLRDMRPHGTGVIPSDEPLLDPHRPAHVDIVTFGEGGDVTLADDTEPGVLRIDAAGTPVELEIDLPQAHQRVNALAGVAAARAIGVTPGGPVEVAFSAMRGERLDLPGGVVVINDCYNANPMSMRAALDDLAMSARGRRVAVLGDMLELGPDELDFHRAIGRHAAECGVDVLVTVGPLAAAMADEFGGETHDVPDAARAAELTARLVREGDTVLVKASRGVGLEVVASTLAERAVAHG